MERRNDKPEATRFSREVELGAVGAADSAIRLGNLSCLAFAGPRMVRFSSLLADQLGAGFIFALLTASGVPDC